MATWIIIYEANEKQNYFNGYKQIFTYAKNWNIKKQKKQEEFTQNNK